MTIEEILTLSFSMNISQIAKNYLNVGEKRVRKALTKAGCIQRRGQRGWIYQGNELSVLKRSVYDFVDNYIKPSPKAITYASTSKTTEKAGNSVDEIRALIKNSKKEVKKRIYRGIYFDEDISQFLDQIQSGNKSEIVNKIIRAYLKDNQLLDSDD